MTAKNTFLETKKDEERRVKKSKEAAHKHIATDPYTYSRFKLHGNVILDIIKEINSNCLIPTWKSTLFIIFALLRLVFGQSEKKHNFFIALSLSP